MRGLKKKGLMAEGTVMPPREQMDAVTEPYPVPGKRKPGRPRKVVPS